MKTKSSWIIATALLFVLISVAASSALPAQANEKARAAAIKEGLERIDFIHYGRTANPGKAKPPTATCYKLMGVKWSELPVDYVINPDNTRGLSSQFVTSAISAAAETWDAATSQELFNNKYYIDTTLHYGVQDFNNVIDFGDYPNSGVIAITSVWYTRKSKQIVEFDMRFNTRFNWGNAASNPSLMDLQNIATHELGHSFGLDDIYNSGCSAVTMYGYSNYGETSKRTLEQPDITGLQSMYGI